MFRLKCCAIILIAFSVAAINCADNNNGAFDEDVENLLNNLPQHLEEALNQEEIIENQGQNRTLPFMSKCSRDFRRIFTSLIRQKVWAFRGML